MGMREVFDAEAVESWAALVLGELGLRRAEIDALNVFPVPDGDTGTNMFLTVESACHNLNLAKAEGTDSAPRLLAALAKGALLGARGNSGVILSEYIRGLVSGKEEPTSSDGSWLARALRRAADQAWQAVSEPKEGTILSVARAAADGAQRSIEEGATTLAEVAAAQAEAARHALTLTTEQLPVLALAGVVDSGGRGLVVLTDAIAEVVTGVHRTLPEFKRGPRGTSPPSPAQEAQPGYDGPAFEVMFLLDAEDDAIGPLRTTLAGLGDSLVVVGGDGLWNVHVHVDDAGAAIEAGMVAGRPYRLKVTYLVDMLRPRVRPGRAVAVVIQGHGLQSLLMEQGDVIPIVAPRLGRPSTEEILAAVEASGVSEVIILPSDKDTKPVAEAAAAHARSQGIRVAVIPTRSIVQSLAAVAVHDVDASFDDDVVAMTRTAGATRYGGVTTAVRRAATSAGVCEVGDELGLIGGDIVEIGSGTEEVARRVVERMLSNGGELLTVVSGEDSNPDLVDSLVSWAERSHPGLEVMVFEGQQPRWPLIVGVE